MRIRINIKYDGSSYEGFERQKNGNGIQNHIENALSKIYKENIHIKASGRTDSGVHANYQVISYDTENIILDIKKKLNNLLPESIRALKVEIVSDDFHPRHSAIKKEYIYKIYLGEYKEEYENYYLQVPYKIDIELMREASKVFLGVHDFRNFASGEKNSFVTEIYSIDIIKKENFLEIKFVGKAFYRYMIRKLVGALLDVGKGKISISDIKSSINLDTNKTFSTAKASGLYLNKVFYC